MKQSSWRCTVITQAALCLALYAALNIGRPQDSGTKRRVRRDSLDLYFLSVSGGFWFSEEQTKLLRQMEKVVKIYKAKFVVNIGKLGEDDLLMYNATMHFPLLRIPWYTTTTSHGHPARNFLKNIMIPHEQVLVIVGIDTGRFQDILHGKHLNGTESDQLRWMQRTLSMTESSWRIVVGFDPLIVCEENNGKKVVKFFEPVRHIFVKYGVNAYLSQCSCAGHQYLDGGIVYLGTPAPSEQDLTSSLIYGNPDLLLSGKSSGFLLHRVSALEIETHVIDSTGKFVSRYVIHQQGRGVM